MFPWPELELTDYERKFVSYYKHFDEKTKTMKPGVLKRVYECVLNTSAVTTCNDFAQVHTIGQVQIARRSRIFGLTFMGDVAAYEVDIYTATGEHYTNGPCLVSAMCPGTVYNGNANVGLPPTSDNTYHFGMAALIIDANWELMPNQTLYFGGSITESLSSSTPYFLKIGVHVWEFPGMELANGGA